MALAPKPVAADATAGLDFSAAFAAAMKDDNAPMPEPTPAPAPAPTGEGDPPAGDPPAGDPPAEGGEKTVDELAAEAAAANGEQGTGGGEGDPPADPAKPAGTPPAADPAPAGGDSVDRLAQVLADRFGQTQPQPQPQPQQQDQELTAESFYSAEERQLIAAYEKEWPDVARVEAIKRRGEYGMVVNHVFREIVKEIRPLAQLVEQLAARQQYATLKEIEPEYDELSDKVAEWVDGMPQGILKNAYTAAITQGSADDMQQLFDAYKKATGYTAAPQGQAPVTRKPVTELPKPTMQAVAALAPVSTKRSAPPAVVPDTFEDAWAMAAKE